MDLPLILRRIRLYEKAITFAGEQREMVELAPAMLPRKDAALIERTVSECGRQASEWLDRAYACRCWLLEQGVPAGYVPWPSWAPPLTLDRA